mgnify:CR=1 FL=1
MQVGTGKSVLNGIAIGKLKIYKKKDTAISAAEVADTAAEVARFEEAQQKAIEQQTALYEKALAEAGEDIAEVFNIHAMMLEDDDFVDAIKEIINSQKKCAEYAVKTAGNNQAAVFAAMDDPYLQARSADVRPFWTSCRGWTTPACRAPSPAFWSRRIWPRLRPSAWIRACCWALSPVRAAPTATPPFWPAA